MAATVRIKVYTGTTAGTENPDAAPGTNAANVNFMSIDSYDSDSVTYQSNPLIVPSSGNNYSFERWIRIHFSGSFTTATSIKFYKSSGVLNDSAIVINGGITASAATPSSSPSTIATDAIPTTAATALDASNGTITPSGYSKYVVLQMKVPSTVVTPNDAGTITYTVSWTET